MFLKLHIMSSWDRSVHVYSTLSACSGTVQNIQTYMSSKGLDRLTLAPFPCAVATKLSLDIYMSLQCACL
ncbi:hypothetical protein K504DRAFT_290056 [Pleomassaria siparia CBS 279.74]|uniref:Uncharacterized protein n=1 Tax=Pleomassaria siparia CBS 279.74 TaxID=1314801 RepID=A0A6G1K8P8_9PLEO|nr:hypothetical protein K504DRAFT_290056 [Pleomassaria siparia CBS 279.74]